MYCLALKPTSHSFFSSFLRISPEPVDLKPERRRFHGKAPAFRASRLESGKRPGKFKSRNPDSNPLFIPSFASNETPLETLNVGDKVRFLASEFKSLLEPIDKVKRLLHYATLLPPFDGSIRVRENGVAGCTAQVWLEAMMDNEGSMRFRVDSDSEITKGFSSCLLWLLDGATPMEVLSVGADDLAEMNVGLPSTGRSRVNTWHNVLTSMQNRTRDCVQNRENLQSLDEFQSLLVRPDLHFPSNGSYKEDKLLYWILDYAVESMGILDSWGEPGMCQLRLRSPLQGQ
nr:sufE-like protein 2, chloroplastic [Ipomoea batatas]